MMGIITGYLARTARLGKEYIFVKVRRSPSIFVSARRTLIGICGDVLKEETAMNGGKTFVVLTLTSALGILVAAPAAASDHFRNRGGHVMPCSLDGVNPVYHSDIFGNPAVAAREYGFVRSPDGTWHVRAGCHR